MSDPALLDIDFKNKMKWVWSTLKLTVKFQKSWPPKFQAGSLQPRVWIARKWHVTTLIWLAQVISHTFKPSMPDEKCFRLSFDITDWVWSSWIIKSTSTSRTFDLSEYKSEYYHRVLTFHCLVILKYLFVAPLGDVISDLRHVMVTLP